MLKLTKIRIIWLALLGLIIASFLFLKIVPFGQITYTRTWPSGLHSGKGFIYDFKPGERIDIADRQGLRILADPVYFSLFTPRRFSEATLTVKYSSQLSTSTPIIEAGVLQDKVSGHYQLKPLENRILDRLRFSWPRLVDENSFLVLQFDKFYQDQDEFFKDLRSGHLKNCPVDIINCIAVYNYPLDLPYRLPDYQSLKPLTITQPLRGAHEFYVYFPGGFWQLVFDFDDLNQDQGQDPLVIRVTSSGENIISQRREDNNPYPTNGKNESGQLKFGGDNLTAGVYKVEIKASDDIVIKKIQSSSNKLAFINKLWPVSGSGELNLFTDTPYIQVKTFNPASLGKVYFAGQPFNLTRTYELFDSQVLGAGGRKEIKLTQDDVILEGNGVFSLSADSLFNPGVRKIDRHFSPDNQVKYIIADYAFPLREEEVKQATAKFNLQEVHRENGKYTFLISVPGLKLIPGQDKSQVSDYLEIKEIKLKLRGTTLWQKIFR